MAKTGRATNPLWGDTVLAGEAMANKNRIVKLSTAANKTILLATAATDQPVGVMPDGVVYESGDDAMFRNLGREKVKLGGTVARGARIIASTAGVGITAPATGSYGCVGFALQSGVIGDVIEFLCFPHFYNAETSAISAVVEAVDPDFFISANKNLKAKAGTGEVDLSLMTGTFKSPTGAHTINGEVAFAANKGITYGAGTGLFDLSLGTGIFKTTTGDFTHMGDVIITDEKNIAVSETTGTKIGTAAAQKLGLWNATPVIQQAHVADPAAASAQTQQTLTDSTGGSANTTLVDCLTEGGGATLTAGDGAKIKDNFADVAAQLALVKTDVAALYTALALHKTAVDAINAKDAAIGITAAA